MKGNISRRTLLKGITYTASLVSFLSFGVRSVSAEDGPYPDEEIQLFRLVDSGFDKNHSSVKVVGNDGTIVYSGEIETIGTNHEDVQGMTHKERYPYIAADIDSFGDLSAGEYTITIEHGELSGDASFILGANGEIADGDKIVARLKSIGELEIGLSHDDPIGEPPEK